MIVSTPFLRKIDRKMFYYKNVKSLLIDENQCYTNKLCNYISIKLSFNFVSKRLMKNFKLSIKNIQELFNLSKNTL